MEAARHDLHTRIGFVGLEVRNAAEIAVDGEGGGAVLEDPVECVFVADEAGGQNGEAVSFSGDDGAGGCDGVGGEVAAEGCHFVYVCVSFIKEEKGRGIGVKGREKKKRRKEGGIGMRIAQTEGKGRYNLPQQCNLASLVA